MSKKIIYACECGKVYRFSDRFVGRTLHCAQCHRENVVPSVSLPDSRWQKAPPVTSEELGLYSHWEISSSQGDGSSSQGNERLEEEIEIALKTDSVVPSSKPEKSVVLGKYKILEKIGEGGMGNVFSAWDTELCREVTIKTLKTQNKRTALSTARFLNEARITARLKHPGIIPVHTLDYDETGNPYFVMQLLEGRTLKQLVKHYHHSKISALSQKTLYELLRHFINVCQTIAYAHDHFVVHRDIKPTNIMLGGYGETFVLDWGLAKQINDQANVAAPSGEEEDGTPLAAPEDEKPDLTLAGARVGTVGYQSPEYLREGISQPSDDIYALGVTLYYLLCDRLPYKIAQNQRVVFDVVMPKPVAPHLINPHVDRPMSAICLHALAHDKKERYRRAEHLAADLQRWLDGEPVSVYRMGRREKMTLLFQKRAIWVGIALTAFFAGFLLARLLM